MKKKLTLLGVLVVSFLFCVVKINALEIVYPEFELGEYVYWDETIGKWCPDYNKDYCINYVVTEDSDSTKQKVKVKINKSDETDVIEIDKSLLARGYVIKATDETEIFLKDELIKFDIQEQDFFSDESVNTIIYYKTDRELLNAINNGVEFDHIYAWALYNNVIIPEGVYVTTDFVSSDQIVVNGILKTEEITSRNISGNGIINLSYTNSNYGDNAFTNTPLSDAIRFQPLNVRGVLVNIINEEMRDDLPFGFIGNVDNYTKEEAQEQINMYNEMLNTDDYKVVLATYVINSNKSDFESSNGTYYYGKLVKEKLNTTVKVKNPKTSDGIINVIAILSLASLGAFVAIKKIKSN